jgi:aminoglycoside phosphotransferase (APT) family kinase protein
VTGVVDWEEAELRGEPLRDLARFALTYALYLDRHTHPGALVAGHPGLHANAWGCGIDYLLYGNGWICDLLRAFLRLGMRRLGVPGDLWREAVVAGVAEVAARADDEDFARAHLRVLARLATGTRPEVR